MNLKKALKHDVEVAGKTIPTMILVGLFLVGGSSAAILSSFGTVSGEADVTQGVVVNDEGQTELGVFGADYDGSKTVTAGATTVDTFEITNNLDSDYSPVYDSELTVADSDDSDSTTIEETGSNVDWQNDEGNQVGIDTTYANYFSDAGHNFSAVDVNADITVDNDEGDDSDSDDIYATISAALDNVGDDEVIYVENHSSGSYDGFTMDVEGVSVVSNGATVEGDVVISANEFRFSGFNVEDASDDNNDIIRVNTNVATDGEISNVLVEGEGKGSADDPTGTAIYLNHQNAASDVEIHDNTFDNAYVGVGGTESFDGSIDYNVFRSNNEAIGVGDDEFSTEGNRFEDNTASFRIYSTGSDGDSDVDADNNFFADQFNIDYKGNDVSDVSASYQTVDSVPSGETVTVGVVNDFDLMINGAYDYSLTTDITTSEATE